MEVNRADERFVKRAIELSGDGVLGGQGGPFGTTIVKDGRISGEGHDMVISTNDATAHAEVVAIREAGKNLNTLDLSGCDSYVNGPPCCMCLASIMRAGISRVCYLLSAKDAEHTGLGDQHLYEGMARFLEDRSIPFISMHELDEEAREVYSLWANKSDKIVLSRSD